MKSKMKGIEIKINSYNDNEDICIKCKMISTIHYNKQ